MSSRAHASTPLQVASRKDRLTPDKRIERDVYKGLFENIMSQRGTRDLVKVFSPLVVDWKMAPRISLLSDFEDCIRAMLEVDNRGILCHAQLMESMAEIDAEDHY